MVKNLNPEVRTALFPLFDQPFLSLNLGKLHNLSEPRVFFWETEITRQIKWNDASRECNAELNTQRLLAIGVLHSLNIMRQVNVMLSLMGNWVFMYIQWVFLSSESIPV